MLATAFAQATPTLTIEEPGDGSMVTTEVVRVSGTTHGTTHEVLYDELVDFEDGTMINSTVTQDGVVKPLPVRVGQFTRQNNGDPVMMPTGGAWDSQSISPGAILKVGSTYMLYYEGYDGTDLSIGLANSSNGQNWNRQHGGLPVLTKGAASSFDENWVSTDFVIRDGSTYKMWYSAHGFYSWMSRYTIGYATSTDTTNWTKSGSPNLTPFGWGQFDSTGVGYGSGFKDTDGTYKIWYSGLDNQNTWRIGYATSSTGGSWTRQNSGNWVLGNGPSGKFDADHAMRPSVFKIGDYYHMFYEGWKGSTARIGYAISDDGIAWERQNNGDPWLSLGQSGKFDETGTSDPTALFDGSQVHMWYNGSGNIGYAVAQLVGFEGTYISEKVDAGALASWNTVTWAGDESVGTSIEFSTRTSQDGTTWSNWEQALSGMNISSPDNRYFQYRINFSTTDITKCASVDSVTVNYTIPVVEVVVSTDSVNWYPALGTPDSWYFDVTVHGGENTIIVKATDTMGEIVQDHIVVTADIDPPEGTVLVNEGAVYTTTRNVTLALTYMDVYGVAWMMIGNDIDFTGGVWEAPSETKEWLLEESDGVKTVYAKFNDTHGHVSDVVMDTIILDTTPPEVAMDLDGGAVYTTDLEVAVSIDASDDNGVAKMQVRADGSWTPDMVDFENSTVFNLTPPDGNQTVWVLVEDSAGLSSEASASIILDTQAPSGSVVIENNAYFSMDREVELNVTATDEVSGIKDIALSNTEDFLGAAWQPYSETVTWTLSEGNGLKQVWVRFRDNAGNTVTHSDKIFLRDTRPTGTLEINGGAMYTNTVAVALNITADRPEIVTDVMLSNSPLFPEGKWETYNESILWVLDKNDGNKTVYMRLRDNYGIVSQDIMDSIILDTTRPEVKVVSPEKPVVKKAKFMFEGTTMDEAGVELVEVKLDDGPWLEANGTVNWSIELEIKKFGAHTLEIKAVDKAGNEEILVYEFKRRKKDDGGPGFETLAILTAVCLVALVRRRTG
jgi:predicted GH43/DUF377 family glycosyl hydrolase